MNETQHGTEPAPVAGLGPEDGWPFPKDQWRRVSKRYVGIDLVGNLIPIVIVLIVWGVFIATGISRPWNHFVVWPLLVIFCINAILAFRRVRTLGYMLREDDLVFRRGLVFQRVVAVPYGRLQLVDIHRGPLLRMFGLSTLKFVTAAATTDVKLPGLSETEANRVRDELIRLAEQRRSGL